MEAKMKHAAIVILSVICCLIGFAGYAGAGEVLLKIPYHSEAELYALPWNRLTVRYEDIDFIIAQAGDPRRLYELQLPVYTILDYVEPDDRYYLMPNLVPPSDGRTNGSREQLDAIEKHGRVLLRFRQWAIVEVKAEREASLLALGLPAYSLLNDTVIPPTVGRPAVPQNFRPASEQVADSQIISQLVDEVDPERLRSTIYDLQENRDLDPPHTAFQSRFCLRVENTDNPSDDACDNAAEYIFRKFQSYGLEVEYDPFDHEILGDSDYFGHGVTGNYEMRNVIGTLPGSGPKKDKIYIVCGHYDSIGAYSPGWVDRWKTMPAPGADDNASGIAAVIETARILSQVDFGYTLRFIAFSGEEIGMLGSQYYAEAASMNNDEIIGVFNLDMIGHESGALDAAVMANHSSAWLANVSVAAGKAHNIDLELTRFVDPGIISSDHSSFWNRRYSAVVFGETYYGYKGTPEWSPVYHTTEDTLDRINMDLVTRTTQILVATLAELANPGNVDLSVLEDEIRISEEHPIPGRPVTITVPVRNLSGIDVKGVNVQIWLEDLQKRRDKLHEGSVDIAAGGSTEVSKSFDPEWGIYDIFIELNMDFAIPESDGTNNMASLDFHILPPDLSVNASEFRFSDPDISLAQPLTLKVPVHNLGSSDILDAEFQILLISPSAAEDEEPQVIGEDTVSIKANQTEEVSAVFTLTELDWYELIVEINSEFKRLEPEDLNNLARKLIKPSPPNLSIEPGDIQLSDYSPDKGQQATFGAQIRNEGAGDAAGTVAQVWIIGPSTDNVPQMISQQELNIGANESQEISDQFLLTQWGEHELTVKINPESIMYETSYDDNNAMIIMGVSSSMLELIGFVIYPNPANFKNGNQMQICYQLSRDADTTIEIYTISGGLVYQEKFASGVNGGRAGTNDGISWSGVNQYGESVASGIYLCRVVATDDQDAVKERFGKIAVIR
jgi:hypothetical protein